MYTITIINIKTAQKQPQNAQITLFVYTFLIVKNSLCIH